MSIANVQRSPASWWKYTLAAVVALIVGSSVTWAGVTLLRPVTDPSDGSLFTLVEVTPGVVSSELSLNTVAEWTPEPVAVNQSAGVVTSVAARAGDEVQVGAVLYTVNLRPVVVAQGDIPSFRAMGVGTQGADVAQLQLMLAALGHYSGPADGKLGEGTGSAIKRWQRSLGVEATGVVSTGDILFVPRLPTRVALDPVVARGGTLSGGEEVLKALPAAPSFTVPVTETQAAMIPTGTRVELVSPSGVTWVAYATDQSRAQDSQTVTVNLRGVDGDTICGAGCAEIPVEGRAQLDSRVITVEPVEGLTVPAAALVSSPSGGVAVIDGDGERHPVEVAASAKGMSVVTGIREGLTVRVPAASSGQ